MITIGHRGAMGHAPENTLASFQKAIELGVDWVELDVYAVDGELVVIHDETLERTTNGRGKITDYTLTELRQLDAGDGQKIPLLGEVFDLVEGRVGINVELKGPATAAPAVAFLQEKIKGGWPTDKLLLSSFDHNQLLQAQLLDAAIARAPLYYGRPPDFSFAVDVLQAVAVNPFVQDVTPEMVNEAHQHGLMVWVYTVNEPSDIVRMRQFGVDGIFTNYPDRV